MLALHALIAFLVVRFNDLRAPVQRDRGDSPVSTAVIVAIIAAGAVTVAGAIVTVANGWVNQIPKK